MLFLCQTAPPSSPMTQHKAPKHGLTRPSQTVNGLRLPPSRGQICLSTNMRIMQPSSPCRGKASRYNLLFQPPILPHSLLYRSSFVSRSDPNSRLSSDVTPINHPLQGCGLLAVIPGGGVFACSEMSGSVVVLRT